MNGQTGKPKTRLGSIALDGFLLIWLVVIGLAVRWLYVTVVVFPPLDDPAFYLTTGENLVTGRGLEVDVLWSYQIPFPTVTHPSHEHWMPLTTGVLAAAFALQRVISGLLDVSLRIGQLPGLVLGVCLAPLTYLIGRWALRSKRGNRWIALGAALLIAINATMSYQSASVDSSAPFALLAAWALTLAVRPPGDEGGYFGVGLLIALAYLTRADGSLLLLAVPLAWWLLPAPAKPPTELPDSPIAQLVWEHLPRDQSPEEDWQRTMGPRIANLLDLGVVFVLVISPWLVRNFLEFGTPLPTSVLSQAWLADYIDTFNFLSHPTWETWLAQGWTTILIQRGQALLHNGGVFLLSTFPWGVLALPGLWLLRREWSFFPVLIYSLLFFFVLVLVFPVSAMSGTFYHSLGAVMPFLALATMYATYRGARRLGRNQKLVAVIFAAVTVGLLVLAGVQVAMTLPAVASRHRAEKEQFEAVASWLAQHAAPGDVVMTTQPYTLNYASGHPCIVLPGNEPPDAAWQAAQHHGAKFLVITQAFGLYPQILHDHPDPRFRLLETTETTEIYQIGGGEP